MITDPPAYELDTAQARRLVGSLCLRPGGRVLHLGTRDAAAARLASYLVGPLGKVVEVDPGAVGPDPHAGQLPFPGGEFDAVLISRVAGAISTDLLAELGRVTMPTGRLAFALVPPATGGPDWEGALVERSGLRGTVVRYDPGAGPDSRPACLVTASPPRPAGGPGSPQARVVARVTEPARGRARDGTYHRIRRPAGAAMRWLRAAAPPAGAARSVVVLGAATVLASGAGVVWGLSGVPDDPSSGVAGAGPRPPGAQADSPVAGLRQLEPVGGEGSSAGGGNPAGGGGLPGGGGSDLNSADSHGLAGNRPPVIEDPGLSSDGMTLTIAPTVSDPDGDGVEVRYDDGSGSVLVSAQPTRTYPVRDGAGGYRYPVEVTIRATDEHGAVTQETVSHQLAAVSTVVVRRVELTVESPQSCFASSAAERFTADLRLRGAVVLDRSLNEELRPDKPTAILLPAPLEVEVIGERPRQDVYLADATLAGEWDSLSLLDVEPPVRPRRLFLDTRCQSRISVGVQIDTR